jgi:hypothetical protein
VIPFFSGVDNSNSTMENFDDYDWPILAPDQPEFKNSKEQFIWFAKRFCHFFAFIHRSCGFVSLPNDEKIDSLLTIAGDDYLIGKASEANNKYGEELKKRSMTCVSKVVAEISSGMTVGDITDEMRRFTDFLDSNEKFKRRFFSDWKILSDILESQ